MSLKKDKQKVLGEVFDDERVKGFLDIEAREGLNSDFLALERAYRGMNIDNFRTFIEFFTQAGKDINAQGDDGKTFTHLVSEHRLAEDYAKVLRDAGGR